MMAVSSDLTVNLCMTTVSKLRLTRVQNVPGWLPISLGILARVVALVVSATHTRLQELYGTRRHYTHVC